ncbi:MAG: glycosyltransferase [Achromobacter sp.]|uniref:glycosyltransferase family 4 protein n=1 Tax=Achromobacter TaxID=222 RepID=UPI000F8F8F37|nr:MULTISPECIES: glycosyltransferase family 4 protein [Achromobacter]AZS77400.1 glycosyltransferase [Achromobacter spanius]MPS81175.1 glycosyltransferase [Achromobacter sp.]CAB3818331.1 D-inositol-3-phosphate glycosyltransferase [Achromobacter piechaudii]
MPRLRILHVNLSSSFGGRELRVLNEMLAMRERGHRLEIACSARSELERRSTRHGFTTHSVEMSGLFAAACAPLRILAILHAGDFEIINTHSVSDDLRTGLLGRFVKTCLLVRTHHREERRRLPKFYESASDHVITVSDYLRRRYLDRGFPTHRAMAVPTSLDVAGAFPESASTRLALGLPDSAIIVGSMADERDGNGLLLLVEAMRPLIEMRPDVHLVLAGLDGARLNLIKRRALDIGLKGRVHFANRALPDDRLIETFDIYAVTPEIDVEGSAFIRASASGLPVVGTAVGCIPEVIKNGVSGYVVLASDVLILRSVLGKLIEDDGLRRRLGRGGYQRFQRHGKFGTARTAEVLEHAYLGWLKAGEQRAGEGI